jgi:pimeloyl-ACP methyl ester carboxylesterase
MRVKPFEIQVADAALDDLRLRLRHARFARVTNEQAKTNGWERGTSPAWLQSLVRYWQEGYDWRRHEARLNELPQFLAEVDGERMHFVHLRGQGPRPTPLLLLHGWPDSFYRFHRVAPAFADPRRAGGDPGDAYDVVVPSLPGFIFTGPLRRPGARQPSRHSAHLIWRLMTEVLGYQRFAVAGGDGGSVLAQILAIDHPENVLGIHLTDLGWHATNVDPTTVSKVEQKYLEASKKHFLADGAYAMVQTTRPRSLAAALNDSPVGLASWLVDRFHAWSDPRVLREMAFSPDDLLTNIMLYWVTQTIGSSMFQYYAEARSPSLTPADRVTVPVGMALFPKDIGGVPPRRLAERTLNVQRWTELPRGGHFAALEEPRLFRNDVVEFFGPLVGADQPITAPGRDERVVPLL